MKKETLYEVGKNEIRAKEARLETEGEKRGRVLGGSSLGTLRTGPGEREFNLCHIFVGRCEHQKQAKKYTAHTEALHVSRNLRRKAKGVLGIPKHQRRRPIKFALSHPLPNLQQNVTSNRNK